MDAEGQIYKARELSRTHDPVPVSISTELFQPQRTDYTTPEGLHVSIVKSAAPTDFRKRGFVVQDLAGNFVEVSERRE
jgi:hypothetical protein